MTTNGGQDPNARRLPDFLEAFEEYGQVYQSTNRFIKAGAIWMVGTAALRNVAMQAGGNTTHPNMYLGMIGSPGTGKSQTVKAVKSIFSKAVNCQIIPASVTRAAMEDYMKENVKQRKNPGGETIFSNECIGLSDEMHGILPDQDISHLTLYNQLYDLPDLHKAQTRSHGEVRLDYPYCSILTGAQPALLAQTIPELAWGMGFMSRMLMFFDHAPAHRDVFELAAPDIKLRADLIHDLKIIHNLNGWMHWDKPAKKFWRKWWVEGDGKPEPTSARLTQGYNARRGIHFMKLALIMSLSRSNDLIISQADCIRALRTLNETEVQMAHIFTEMANTGASSIIHEILQVVKINSAAGKLTDEAAIIEMLLTRVPANQIPSTINNLANSKAIITAGGIDSYGCRKFNIGPKVAVL